MLEHEKLTEAVIGAAIEVHRHLGPGLLESAYEVVLAMELRTRGFKVARQMEFPVEYKGTTIDLGYRIDLLIEDVLVLELKAVEKIAPIHEAQIVSYLRLANKPVGLLINFHSRLLKDGIKRYANLEDNRA